MKSVFLLSLGLALTVCTSAIAESARPAEMISKYRLQHGEGLVTPDTSLNRVAQDQANAMAAKDLLDHGALGPFNSRVASLGSTFAAENIAFGYSDFPRTLDQWIESSGHRKNLLMHDASRVGVASAKSSTTGRTYWAMVIAGGYKSPKSSATAKRQAVRTCRVSILGICL
jgi:uncharacterized protein YkwD